MPPTSTRHEGPSGTSRPNVADSLRHLEKKGFEAQFIPREGAKLQCGECRYTMSPEEIRQLTLRRVDFETDPSQQALIAALECPQCHAKGTYAFSYGPQADANEAEILRILRGQREQQQRDKEERERR